MKPWAVNINLRICCLAAVGAVALFFCAVGLVDYRRTLVDWWQPVAFAVIGAAVTGLFCARRWRMLSSSPVAAVNWSIHILVAGSLLYGGFLDLNYRLADEAAAYAEEVTVIARRVSEHSRTVRAGRHRFRHVGMRYDYYQTLRFADGREKVVDVSRNVYLRYRPGSVRTVTIQTGFFKVPVLKKQ